MRILGFISKGIAIFFALSVFGFGLAFNVKLKIEEVSTNYPIYFI